MKLSHLLHSSRIYSHKLLVMIWDIFHIHTCLFFYFAFTSSATYCLTNLNKFFCVFYYCHIAIYFFRALYSNSNKMMSFERGLYLYYVTLKVGVRICLHSFIDLFYSFLGLRILGSLQNLLSVVVI